MNRTTPWAAASWALTLSGATAVVVAASVSPRESETVHARAPDRTAPAVIRYPADSLSRRLIGRDPFRVVRRASDVVYDPLRAASIGVAAPAAPKPVLLLTGIVWGATPQAVVEGLPGVDRPRVLRAGDVVAGVAIRRIEPDRVTVVGMDTVWVLTVRRPWQ